MTRGKMFWLEIGWSRSKIHRGANWWSYIDGKGEGWLMLVSDIAHRLKIILVATTSRNFEHSTNSTFVESDNTI